MSFDPMAAAIDWLDAYRARDLDTLMAFFKDDAVLECTCCITETLVGCEQLRAFWPKRFKDCGASDEVHDLTMEPDGASISYIARDRLVTASFRFFPDGKIAFMQWGTPPNWPHPSTLIECERRSPARARPRRVALVAHLVPS